MHPLLVFGLHHWELVSAFFIVLGLFLLLELYSRFTQTVPLSPQEAVLLINRENAVVLDIRDHHQFKKSHIARAVNFPYAELRRNMKPLEAYKTKPIVISFTMGQDHRRVGRLLKDAGFTRLYHLKGGIVRWQSAGLPLTKA